MPANEHEEREIRAARNEAVFRAVNERIHEVQARLAEISERQTIACECADIGCINTFEISRGEYEAVRANARRFAVVPGHIDPAIERVVDEHSSYTVVEKIGVAGEFAEAAGTS